MKKKQLAIIISLICTLLCTCALTACDNKTNSDINDNEQNSKITDDNTNNVDSETPNSDIAEAYAVYSVGDTFGDFSLKKVFADDEDEYTLSDDLNDGKVVILNFWYMGCQPCQQEIPYFLELAADENYADKVSLVIIHAGDDVYRSDDVVTSSSGEEMLRIERYISTDDSGCMGWGGIYGSATWCIDVNDESSVFLAAGGTSAYPVTVILDSDGVVQFQSVGSVEEEELYSEVDRILNN